MQTEATMLTNISQHFWMLHVTLNPAAFRHLVTCSCELLRVAACCFCVFLRVVGSYCSKFETGWTFDPTTPTISFFPYMIAEAGVFLRPCLHGVGDPGVVGLVSFVFTLWGHKTKETYPTRPGSPTPCKQGLRVAETIADSLLCCDVGIVQHLFNLLYYVCYTTTWEISTIWLA